VKESTQVVTFHFIHDFCHPKEMFGTILYEVDKRKISWEVAAISFDFFITLVIVIP
jgi:hypothetical protein